MLWYRRIKHMKEGYSNGSQWGDVCTSCRTVSFLSVRFFIHFPKPELSRATVSSFNQFSKCKNTPSRTVGNEYCNNNNTKSNLNYALKRLGQYNPQNKHKRGGGDVTCDQMQGGELHHPCVDVFLFLMVGFVESCVWFWVQEWWGCLFWEMRVCWGLTESAIIKVV